jgi:DNA polymerase-3 subunit gamma/tau
VRRLWPDVVEATKLRRRVAWMHLTQNCQVVGLEGRTLVLGFSNAGARDSFVNGGCDEILRQAAIDVVGVDWRIDAIVDPGARAGETRPAAEPVVTPSPEPVPAPDPGAPTEPPGWVAQTPPAPSPDASDAPDGPAPEAGAPETPQARGADPSAIAAARGAISPTRVAGAPVADTRAEADADAHPDDPDIETSGLAGAELLERELGARVIEEIPHQ